ncbi:alpha/beta hydrolase [Maribacter algarum]|uniref:Alpha/beta hydrolase n=1 Tax=Maribacter algarum (ex Zhang et al. 2020) TaxID=2578118 RepID=A0A5S3PHB4_9FLAO|nr:alpha/beta hydrolase [Maribacter algarum]TMM53655.1 alpha/beta hydrolase [Maribacter algarum]
MRQILLLALLLFSIAMSGQTKYFNSFDDTKIAYTDEGEGKPILLIHGFINTRKSWDKTALKKDLLAKGYRVIVPDLRGNGDSDKPHDEDAYSKDAEVMDLLFLMAELRIRKYDAVGYSRGSIVLAKLLTKTRRIKKAVLGGMGIDFTNPNWHRRIIFKDAFDGKITEETKGAVEYAKSIGADLKCLYLQQKHQSVTTKRQLQVIKAKVMVLVGDEDRDNGDAAALSKVIPKSKLQIIKGDHNGTYKTEAFSKAVISFL